MRSRLALLLLAACGSPSRPAPVPLGELPSEHWEPADTQLVRAASEGFAAGHGGSWELDLDPVTHTLRALRGSGLAMAASDADTLAHAALAFVDAEPALFGGADFVVDGTTIDHDGTLASIVLAQRHQGLPVVGGHLALAVSHGKLVLVEGAVYPIRDLVTSPHVARGAALATTRAAIAAPAPGDRDDARLVILPTRTPGAIAYHLAWQVTAWRGDHAIVASIDAHDGELLGAYDAARYDYPGTATALVDQRTVGDDVVTLPAAYLRLASSRGVVHADGAGAFAFRGAAGPLVVTATLRGRYVDVRNRTGNHASYVGLMLPEAHGKIEWNRTRSDPAERDVFRGVNETNRFVSTVFPDLPWMATALVANVNLPRTCNAFWNGSSINFFSAGNGCNNTGQIFDVIAHEWGHGLDQFAPGGAADGALGEFIGDLISFVQTDSPLLAPGFFTHGGAVRDLEDPEFECYDPKKREVHAAGHLLGTVMWDVYRDLKTAGLTGEPLKRLLLRPIAIAQTRSQWYGALLAVDDDDGDLANGTPHECLIYRQFEAHSCKGKRWPGMPAEPPPHCRN